MPSLNVGYRCGGAIAANASLLAGSDGDADGYGQKLARQAIGDYICLKSLAVIVMGHPPRVYAKREFSPSFA